MNIHLLATIVAATQAGNFAWADATAAEDLKNAGYIVTNPNVPNAPAGQVAARATDQGTAFLASQSQGQGQDANSGFGGAPADNSGFGGAMQQTTQTQTQPQQNTAPASQPQGATSRATAFVPVPAGFQLPTRNDAAPKARREQPETYPFGQLQEAPVTGTDTNGNPVYDYSKSAIFVPSTDYPANDKQKRTGKRSPEDMAFSLQSACSAANRRYAEETGTKTVNGKTRKVYKYTREFKAIPGTNPNGSGEPGAFIYRVPEALRSNRNANAAG